MTNLIIGETSQLSYHFPKDYKRISSRNINFKLLSKEEYDTVYICFADQRTYIRDVELEKEFLDLNFFQTIDVINFFKKISKRVVVYSTCELWNNLEGPINLNTPFNYIYSPYIKSKDVLSTYILDNKKYYQNVIIIYPFNFNSPYRRKWFLFGKIFYSILYKTKIVIGDTNMKRDLIHPSYIVERSIKAEKDELVGSGNLINVNKFIRDLYKEMNMVYEDYVYEDYSISSIKKKEYYCDTDIKYQYELLLQKTIEDIKNYKL